MNKQTILEERSPSGILLMRFNRPERKNAFNGQMWREATETLSEAQQDEEVRVVVITGSGSAFSAGQDLGEMQNASTESATGFPQFMDQLITFDKPLIAAVNGVGVGIGITLLLHCDYVLIAENARLRAPFVTLGVAPEAGSSYLFPAILGYRAATDLLFESDFITATRATELGLATQCCKPSELLPEAVARAEQLAKKPLGSLRATKRLLLATREDAVRAARSREDQAFVGRIGSPENIEAIQAFFEKREADFSKVPSHDRKVE